MKTSEKEQLVNEIMDCLLLTVREYGYVGIANPDEALDRLSHMPLRQLKQIRGQGITSEMWPGK
jgi:hypothetical protein